MNQRSQAFEDRPGRPVQLNPAIAPVTREGNVEEMMRLAAKAIIGVATLFMLAIAAPVFADTPTVPPGNPCLMDNGNPCKDNNGNLGHQGNVNKERVVVDTNPPPIDLSMPPVSDRGVFISQIGDGNVANAIQTAPNAYASVAQNGNSNDAELSQTGTGTGYVALSQTADSNYAAIDQSGSGQNVVYATQDATGNWLRSNQSALGSIFNGAELTQTGNYNDMKLDQVGSDNLVVLTQTGDNDAMTATQLGDDNRLTWIQQGDNLSDLQITQTGGAVAGGQLMITQTNIGNGNGK
jgi:minor curlin subunit